MQTRVAGWRLAFGGLAGCAALSCATTETPPIEAPETQGAPTASAAPSPSAEPTATETLSFDLPPEAQATAKNPHDPRSSYPGGDVMLGDPGDDGRALARSINRSFAAHTRLEPCCTGAGATRCSEGTYYIVFTVSAEGVVTKAKADAGAPRCVAEQLLQTKIAWTGHKPADVTVALKIQRAQ